MKLTAQILAFTISFVSAQAMAADYNVGDIEVSAPWTRATPKGASVAGAYMTITNKGTTADRLLGGSSPAAARFELHVMTEDQGVMRMRPLKDGLEIKPGATVVLKPDGIHIMLVGLKAQLQRGQQLKATLSFEHAGKVDIEYPVESIGATGAATPMNHMNGMEQSPAAH